MPTIEKISEGCLLSEGPHWDEETQILYFVDIFGKKVCKYDPKTKKTTVASLEKSPSFIIPIEGRKNEFVSSMGNELIVISWDGESDKVSITQKLSLLETSPEQPKTFNDAKCDSSGKLWAGAHVLSLDFYNTQPLGNLYSLDSNCHLKSHVDQIRCSNGITFNDKTKKLYYIDSLENVINQFDLDVNSGILSNRQRWFTFQDSNDLTKVLDGMTIDTDGNLWVAVFGGYCVLKISGNKPETLLDTIKLPMEQVTSVIFGGPNFDELFVTTGAIDFAGRKAEGKGAVFKITELGVKGLPGYKFKLNK